LSPTVMTATLRWLVLWLDVAAPLALMAHLVIARGDVVARWLVVTDPETALAKRFVEDARPPETPPERILESYHFIEKTACEVHGVPMPIEVIPIVGGYPPPGYDIDRREEELKFPNAHDVFAGGCIPIPETHARVTYCPVCRRAKASWLAAHPELSPLGNVRY
jgi:hypothetical protein